MFVTVSLNEFQQTCDVESDTWLRSLTDPDVTLVDTGVFLFDVPQDDGEVSFHVLIRETFHPTLKLLVLCSVVLKVLFNVQDILVIFVPPGDGDGDRVRQSAVIDAGQQDIILDISLDLHLTADCEDRKTS